MTLPCRLLLVLLLAASLAQAEAPRKPAPPPVMGYDSRFQPAVSLEGMVVSSEILASRVGARILAEGGNAVDAAVATGFALAVTYPQAGNLGGGGFMLVYLADAKRTIAIDYRETAPAKATRDMFLDPGGNVVEGRSQLTHLASGVPGTVAGLLMAHERYGKLTRGQVLAPAIALAEKGIPMSFTFAGTLAGPWSARLRNNEAALHYFFKPDGSVYQPGEILKQRDLAWTLKQIAARGADGFYRGPVAERLVAEMERGGGLITREDLATYRAIEREPVRGRFHGYEVVSMPPPSSGGVHLVEMLNVLDGYPLKDMQHNSAAYIHVLAETMKRAYADRSKYLGDPDFFHVPVAELTSDAYARQIRASIDLARATPAAQIAPAKSFPHESTQTTHFAVADREGNLVSNTYTLNYSFGNGIAVPGLGFFLNNEMDDFAVKPGVPNAFGLTGDEANAVGPAKRPLSSMTPTIVLKDGEPWLATGAPGGPRIITVVLQIILNATVFDMNIAEATAQSRVHHQWLPDTLTLEPGIGADTAALLQRMGHTLNASNFILGNAQSLMVDDGVILGASDTRRPGGGAASVEELTWPQPAALRLAH
jgi:gamma-glutamyltranspeptidase/glutathione hydrolase